MVSHHRTHPASTLNGSTCLYPQDVRSRDYLMRLLSDLDSQSLRDPPRSPLGRDGLERLSRRQWTCSVDLCQPKPQS